MLSRIRSCLALGISERIKLPKYIVLILDDDLIKYLSYCDQGVAALYGEWIDWLAKTFTELVSSRKSILPTKATKIGYPQIYWVAPPSHCHFNNNQARKKLLNCLEVGLRLYENIRLIRMKEIWEFDNVNLVDRQGRITPYGLSKYWQSVDSAIKFNVLKREQFLARMNQFKGNNDLRNSMKSSLKRKIDKQDRRSWRGRRYAKFLQEISKPQLQRRR